MKMNRGLMWTAVTVLALGVSLLAMPISHAQKAAGMSRVGWLGSVVPVLGAPISIFSGVA
jgi:hypothetical protein